MSEIRLAIAGVGNCASALVQGIQYYETNPPDGLIHSEFGKYGVEDISPVCGFDVDERKIGEDITDAIHISPNCTKQFVDEFESISAPVYRGPLEDGVASHMGNKEGFNPGTTDPVDVAAKLRTHDVDILITYLPVGSTEAVKRYARACLEADVALVNPIPVFIASDSEWQARFERAGLPVIGDDIKSQIGATITHRALVQLLEDRGVDLHNTYQLNYGGNTDFKNMLDESRLSDKRVSKTEAVNTLLSSPLDDQNIHIGPSDHVSWMDDTKRADIKLEGSLFGNAEFELTAELTVEDSPNSAGSAVDAIRGAKIALDRGTGGTVESVSAMTMKSPPKTMSDEEARSKTRAFIDGSQ